MTITTTQMYQALSEKVGKETAETLTNFVEQKIADQFAGKTDVFATKADLANLRADLMGGDTLLIPGGTKADLANLRADLMKWMFIFWIGQVTVTIGVALLIFKR